MRPIFVVLVLLSTAAIAQPSPVVITGLPVAPPIETPGPGLCASSRISTNPALDFPQTKPTFNAGVTSFLEANPSSRVTSVLRTIFDLSNNNSGGILVSYGDFTNSDASCPTGGCEFQVTGTTTSFASRFRGYLNISSAMTGRPLHFGFYADDAVSLTVYDRTLTPHEVITRPPQLGQATWRTTNSVTFNTAGLYPIEILYAEIGEHAALEFSLLDGAFTDFELGAGSIGSLDLNSQGFTLLTPDSFHQTENGLPSFADPNQCVQCNRQFANLPGNGGCSSGYSCNAAALCAPL
jgi:outer membrane exchange protein TraA